MKAFIYLFVPLILIIRVLPVVNPDLENKNVRIHGYVSSLPYGSFDKQTIRLGGMRATVKSQSINYGDYVVVEGLVKDKGIEDGVVVSHVATVNIFSSIHDKLVSIVSTTLPGNHAALLTGIVLGDKQLISRELYEKFKVTGVAHVVVASGMNVTLLAGFVLSALLKFTNRKRAVYYSITTIWIYVLIAGIAAPLVRAGIMGSITFLSQALGRESSATRALVISLLLMIIVYPWWIYDIGLWLSFAATLSLILFEPKVNRYVKKVPVLFREGLSTSLAAQIGVSPILLFSFGTLSLIGPLVNMLVLWTVTPLMIIGLSGILIGVFIPILGQLILYLALPLTHWFLFVVEIFS